MQSINPYTGEVIAEHAEHDLLQTTQIIEKTHESFQSWKKTPIETRASHLKRFALLLNNSKDFLAKLITTEMGKILSESKAEIDKCVWLCNYYAENGAKMLEEEGMTSDGTISYICYEPIGVVYAIMPWNFPFWQVLRFAVPTILAGNTVILKHAPNVIGCAKQIESLFVKAGFPENVFSNIVIPVELSENVIAHKHINGVTITGSQHAGRIVASQAGRHLKKSVLELGGSDPYIVFADADFNKACKTGVDSRMMNSGQVCISAKRFLVEDEIFNRFIKEQKQMLESMLPGDPMSKTTTLAPMARPDLLAKIDSQVRESVESGAKLVTGGEIIDHRFYSPTLLTDVEKGMPAYDEETFGPVSVVMPFKDASEAVFLANDTPFGLGASVWTKNIELAEEMARRIDTGSVFINGMTKSDPRLPFGGTKQSGYGRELSHFGIREFVNVKAVWIK